MRKFEWIIKKDAEAIHSQSLEKAGGADGIRDPGLLDSALARPQNAHAYGETDVFELAATYTEAIALNHPFVDGNKRTAFASADIFLLLNGHDLKPSPGDEHADKIIALTEGKITKSELAQHYKSYCVSRDQEQSQSLKKK